MMQFPQEVGNISFTKTKTRPLETAAQSTEKLSGIITWTNKIRCPLENIANGQALLLSIYG